MTHVFVFDIDGTLTSPRQPMTTAMAVTLADLANRYPVYLVTGSDWPKVLEQVPAWVRSETSGIFTCAGAEHWRHDGRVSARSFTFPPALIAAFEELATASPYPHRLGRHVERRTGMINVSVVGRNADNAQRKAYRAYDDDTGERARIVRALKATFPDFHYSVGGDISIDIAPTGWTKAQVLPTLLAANPRTPITFFGDRMSPGGNDLPLAEALWALADGHGAVGVEGPDETLAALAEILSDTDAGAWPEPFLLAGVA